MVTLCLFIFFSSWARGANQFHASLEKFGAVPVPHWQLGPSGVVAAFSLAAAPWQRSLDYPWHCVTPSSPAAGWLGRDSAAPQHEWGWSADTGKLVVSALLPTLGLICVLLCNQPKRKLHPASNTCCPPSASITGWVKL